jgi:hypothetical protein
MPDAAWQQRVDEWTPEVSARGWARAITDQAEGNAALGLDHLEGRGFGLASSRDPGLGRARVSDLERLRSNLVASA